MNLDANAKMLLTEDARYLTSSQYRLWSFTPAALAELRQTTNRNAVEYIRSLQAAARAPSSSVASGNTTENDTGDDSASANANASRMSNLKVEDDCELSADEELELLSFYGSQLLGLADFLKLPTEAKATALQYFKRFYTTHSLLTFPPNSITKTALFFSTKTENHYIPLTQFCETVSKTTEQDVLAYEFPLTQGLRFTFDVRHPFRALEGAVMEIQALAESDGTIDVVRGGTGVGVAQVPKHAIRRAREAHGKARKILQTKALLSDVYFHYTPSQIMFSALQMVDPELAAWYLDLKISDKTLSAKLNNALKNCQQMMNKIDVNDNAVNPSLKKINGKLKKCQKLMGLNGLDGKGKRGGETDEENAAKKRKLERDGLAKEGERLFGPELGGSIQKKAAMDDPFGPTLGGK